VEVIFSRSIKFVLI